MIKKLFCLLVAVVSIPLVQGAQSCQLSVSVETAPASEFTINNDGTVLHYKTGLIWTQCSLGQTWSSGDCTGTTATYTWAEALGAAEQARIDGYASNNTWRLPNIKELGSIIEYACSQPAINLTVFPNTSETLSAWSSSPYAATGNNAWYTKFAWGQSEFSLSKDEVYSVRLVRDQ